MAVRIVYPGRLEKRAECSADTAEAGSISRLKMNSKQGHEVFIEVPHAEDTTPCRMPEAGGTPSLKMTQVLTALLEGSKTENPICHSLEEQLPPAWKLPCHRLGMRRLHHLHRYYDTSRQGPVLTRPFVRLQPWEEKVCELIISDVMNGGVRLLQHAEPLSPCTISMVVGKMLCSISFVLR